MNTAPAIAAPARLSDQGRYRRIVTLASTQSTIAYAKEWFFRDERGVWEKEAASLWEKSTPRRLALLLSDAEAEEQVAMHLCLQALTVMANTAKRSK